MSPRFRFIPGGAIAPFLALTIGLAVPVTTHAQQPGQWSWNAEIGLRQQQSRNIRDGASLGRFDQKELRVGFGLEGYLVHPSVVGFRAGVDMFHSRFEGRGRRDSKRYGLGLETDLFPRGAIPVRLFYKQQLYDDSGEGLQDPLIRIGVPDRSARWGGRMRLRRGPLKGLLLGLERQTVDFLDPGSGTERQDLDFIDFSRQGRRLRHHVRLERRQRRFGTIDLGVEDFTINIDERGDLSDTWRWEMSGIGVRRETMPGQSRFRTDDVRLRNRFLKTVRDRDLLDLFASVGRVVNDTIGRSDSQAMSVFYRWRPSPSWEVAPFTRYLRQDSVDQQTRSPRAGLSTAWRRERGAFDSNLTARLSAGLLRREGSDGSSEERISAAGLTGRVGHGQPSGLRKELEVELARDEFRLTRDPILLPQEGGLVREDLGREDFWRARGSLQRSWSVRQLSGWAEWQRRESRGSAPTGLREVETVLGNVHFSDRRIGLQADAGRTSVRQSETGEQDFRFLGLTSYWRPLRWLTVRASYRYDERRFVLTPRVEGRRADLGATVQLGTLSVEGYLYENDERLAGTGGRTNRGFRWSITTRFGGWLPIVTGARNGVIR